MILDLIVILLVVVLSYLCCLNTDKSNDKYKKNCLLSHVVVGLTVIVFYKLVKYYKIKENNNKNTHKNTHKNTNSNNSNSNSNNKEKFTVDSTLNDFISNNTGEIVAAAPSNLNNTTLADYTNKINNLTAQLQILNNNTQSCPASQVQGNTNNIDSISLDNQQAYQQFQINFLAKQIQNAQDIINADSISSSSQNYKPIKVFSSCVANADGTLTSELPVKSAFENNPSQSVLNSKSGQQILSTVSQNNPNIQTKLQALLSNISSITT